MAQMKPRYPFMTSAVNELFTNPLISKYGEKNVIWPIVLIKDDKINSYLYESSEHCLINKANDSRPTSESNKNSFNIDYRDSPRKIIPASNELEELTKDEYTCSYDCVVNSPTISSVDLDYTWFDGDKWNAIELTTLWVPLSSKSEAERLGKMFTRRPSWKGNKGPHGMRKLIDSASDLNLNYWMVCVNSVKGVSNSIVTDGNAFRFPLNHTNIDRILNGQAPNDSVFSKFSELIEWL
jgi:hypothetical protein